MHKNDFPTLEQFQELLSAVIDEIPQAFFEELSGGIVLLDQSKHHKDSRPGRPLYIMGEYQRSVLGKQIKIYYGSFRAIYSNSSLRVICQKINEVVRHEFTHHLEFRAGLRGLEIEDAKKIDAYNKKP